jgi:hypothetical protein
VFIFSLFCTLGFFFLPFYIICLEKMSRRVATPINVPSNAPKRARISSSITGSSSTVLPSSSPAPTAVASFDSFEPSRLQGPVGSSANGPTLEAIFAQMQQQEQIQRRQEENQRRQELKIEQLTQLLQQQQQGQQQQQQPPQQPPQQQPSEVKENRALTSVI